MKIFYIENMIAWNKLFSYAGQNQDEVYEINLPDLWSDYETSQCKNIIRLWDEKKYGKKYEREILCGEHHRRDDLYNEESIDFLYKIDDVIGMEKVIVLAISNDTVSFQLLDYFLRLKKQKDLKLHIFMNLMVPIQSNNDRFLLHYLRNITELDSVAFFNHALLRNIEKDDDLSIDDWLDDVLVCEELLAEEAGKVLLQITDLKEVDEDELWLYYWEQKHYERIKICEEDFIQQSQMDKTFFEIITPNEGRATCEKLRQYRKMFRLKYGLNKRESVCNYMGVCRGVCEKCEVYASEMWKKVYEDSRQSDDKGMRYSSYVRHHKGNREAGINNIIRLRDGIDGPGIRTLVLMNDCHLHCKNCINEQFVNVFPIRKKITTAKLMDYLLKDVVYFEMTGGGVTFGGGEPLLNSEFIINFKEIYPDCSIAVETSLNVSFEIISVLIDVVAYWIIDIKDMNDEIYYRYTGNGNLQVIQNLKFLVNHIPKDRILCRVPKIDGYNTDKDIEASVMQLQEMGISEIELFEYKK